MNSKITEMYRTAAAGLERLAERLDHHDAVSAIDCYDVGIEACGACEDCLAWPGERHAVSFSGGDPLTCPTGTCPRDPEVPRHGALFLGDWTLADVPALERCHAALYEVAGNEDLVGIVDGVVARRRWA